VFGGPFHSYFRYYASAWAAFINVQGAQFTAPNEPLQIRIVKWFAFDSSANVITPPYLELEADGDFTRCAWESLYSPIAPLQ
jgi:hypothetical protein